MGSCVSMFQEVTCMKGEGIIKLYDTSFVSGELYLKI